MFGWFKKKDPVCGMSEEKGKGIAKDGNWFCSSQCLKQHEEKSSSGQHKEKGSKHGCCCGP